MMQGQNLILQARELITEDEFWAGSFNYLVTREKEIDDSLKSKESVHEKGRRDQSHRA
jgi:hypothetical protein